MNGTAALVSGIQLQTVLQILKYLLKFLASFLTSWTNLPSESHSGLFKIPSSTKNLQGICSKNAYVNAFFHQFFIVFWAPCTIDE
jgi:hypothetical protein